MSGGFSDLTESANFFAECLGWRIVGGTLARPALHVVDGATTLTLWRAQDRTPLAKNPQGYCDAADRRVRHTRLARRA